MDREQLGALLILIGFFSFIIWGIVDIWKENPKCLFFHDIAMCIELTKSGVIRK